MERLSRDADLVTTDEARRHLCLVLATNGLRDVNLQRELIDRNMNWAEFTRILKSRSVASQAVQILDVDTESTRFFKREVGVVTNFTKSSSYLASDCCNNSSSHSVNCKSEAEPHNRERQYDIVMIYLMATNLAGLLLGKVIALICINCY